MPDPDHKELQSNWAPNPKDTEAPFTGGDLNKIAKAKKSKQPSKIWATADYDKYFKDTYGLTFGQQGKRMGDAFTHNELEVEGREDRVNFSFLNVKTHYEPELQACRWLSTVAYNYLYSIGQKPEEVQCLYDEEEQTVYIAANQNEHTRALMKGGKAWTSWMYDEEKPVPNTVQNFVGEAVGERIDRHVGEILLEMGQFDRALERLKTLPDIDSVHSCAKRKMDTAMIEDILGGEAGVPDHDDTDRFTKVLRPKHFKYVTLAATDPMHAESKIVQVWRETHKKAKQAHTLYVAGVMRPCLACYIRLNRHKVMLKEGEVGHELIIKERPGPFWFTDSALCGAIGSDHDAIVKYLKDVNPLYLSLWEKEVPKKDPNKKKKVKAKDQETSETEIKQVVYYAGDSESGESDDNKKEYAFKGDRRRAVSSHKKGDDGERDYVEEIKDPVSTRTPSARHTGKRKKSYKEEESEEEVYMGDSEKDVGKRSSKRTKEK